MPLEPPTDHEAIAEALAAIPNIRRQALKRRWYRRAGLAAISAAVVAAAIAIPVALSSSGPASRGIDVTGSVPASTTPAPSTTPTAPAPTATDTPTTNAPTPASDEQTPSSTTTDVTVPTSPPTAIPPTTAGPPTTSASLGGLICETSTTGTPPTYCYTSPGGVICTTGTTFLPPEPTPTECYQVPAAGATECYRSTVDTGDPSGPTTSWCQIYGNQSTDTGANPTSTTTYLPSTS